MVTGQERVPRLRAFKGTVRKSESERSFTEMKILSSYQTKVVILMMNMKTEIPPSRKVIIIIIIIIIINNNNNGNNQPLNLQQI